MIILEFSDERTRFPEERPQVAAYKPTFCGGSILGLGVAVIISGQWALRPLTSLFLASMSDNTKKKDLLVIEDISPASPRRTIRSESRKMRKLNPLGMRVVVQLRKDSNQTETGLYLPEGAKQAMSESIVAEVIEVASAMDDHTDEETNISGVPLGATVLIMKDAGVRVPWDESLRIVETKDILAVVNEISLS